jgi:hypothetical protein
MPAPPKKRMMGDSYEAALQQGGALKKRKVAVGGVSVPLGKSWWRYGEIQKDAIQSIANKPEVNAQTGAARMAPAQMSAMYESAASATSRVVSVDNLSQSKPSVLQQQGNRSVSSIIQSLQARSQSLSQAAAQQTSSLNNATFHAAAAGQSSAPQHGGIPNAFFRQESAYQDSAASSIVDDEGDDDCSEDSSGLKFRAYQAENWTEKFEELIEFRNHFGHCLVPNAFPDNPALAQWVKRQRYQYKLKTEAKRSTMSDERITALEEIGFVWDSHSAIWDERLQDLIDYKLANGHCNVPSRYTENRQLAVWVKRQRRQYKFFCDGQPSSMTEQRIARLNVIGFEWDLRQKK